MRPGPSGIGVIIGIAIIIATIYYSGAGNWLARGLQGLGPGCYSLVPNFGQSVGNAVCNGVNQGAEALLVAGQDVDAFLQGVKERYLSWFSSVPDTQQLAALGDSLGRGISEFASPRSYLEEMMRTGPQQFFARNAAQPFQQAIDSFSISQYYMQHGGYTQAMPWLQQSARQDAGFGLLSQLSLGDIYSRGAGGVPRDPVQAQAYYRLASDSMRTLSSSNSPQAQQMLRSLPASPAVIQRQLNQAIRQLQPR